MADKDAHGWDLYFPGEEYAPDDTRIPLIDSYYGCLSQNAEFAAVLEQLSDKEETVILPIDYEECESFIPANLLNVITEQPDVALKALGMACYRILQGVYAASSGSSATSQRAQQQQLMRKVMPRFYKYQPCIPMRHLKSHLIGRLVCVKGTVVRVSNIRPMVVQVKNLFQLHFSDRTEFWTKMSFRCTRCNLPFKVHFKDGKYKNPTKCTATSGCRSRIFLPEHNTCKTVDWQKIRIQEQLNNKDPGRVPRTIECELTEDLVDTCVPGDVVTICGTVKVLSTDIDRGAKKLDKSRSLLLIYIEANSVENQKQMDTGKMDLQFNAKDLQGIHDIAYEEHLFTLICNSLCPGIYGHEMVKAGLALSLFGGEQKNAGQKNKMPIRGDPHILIVGDPGLGKSQMLTAVANIAPRGVYVCGSYSSTTGLTVSLLKESGSGDYALEAGALVLGDQGVCCIDEFDKMVTEHQALLEAMEQQSISIAKAGIVCNLPARTSVIAAANPVGGHYNRSKTVCENLKMNAALLSRFDLIFILLDRPDEERDQMLSEHVMAIHGGGKVKPSPRSSQDSSQSQSSRGWRDGTLAERLKFRQGMESIHPQLLRKYIGYARKYVHPKLTPGAAKVIQQFYLTLREKHRSTESTPITTRQLESLIRLSEARARLELREEITEKDAEDVVEIMKESLFERFEDEHGNIDFRRSSGMSKTKEVNRFVAELQRVAERTYNSVFTMQQLYTLARSMNLKIDGFEDFVENLNTQNYLIKKPNRTYKLMTTSFS